MNQNIDEIFEVDDKHEKIAKKITLAIRTKILKNTVISIICVCLFAIAGYKGYDFAADYIYYNPLKESGLGIKDESIIEMLIRLDHGPDVYISEIEKTGPAAYRMRLSGYIGDIEEKERYLFVNKSKMTSNVAELLQGPQYEFIDYQYVSTSDRGSIEGCKKHKENLIKEIKQMPDSMQIEVSLSFKEYMTPDKLIKFKNACNTGEYWFEFRWGAIHSDEKRAKDGYAIGTELEGIIVHPTDYYEYPMFDLSNNHLTEKKLITHYRTQLEIAMEHPEITKMYLDMYDMPDEDRPDYAKRYEDAKKGIQFYGVNINSNSKDEILKLVQNEQVLDFTITYSYDANEE